MISCLLFNFLTQVEEEEKFDWRCKLVSSLVQVYKAETQVLEAELNTVKLYHATQETSAALKSFDNRLKEQVWMFLLKVFVVESQN